MVECFFFFETIYRFKKSRLGVLLLNSTSLTFSINKVFFLIFLDHSKRRSDLINNYLRTKALFDSRYGTFGITNGDFFLPGKIPK